MDDLYERLMRLVEHVTSEVETIKEVDTNPKDMIYISDMVKDLSVAYEKLAKGKSYIK